MSIVKKALQLLGFVALSQSAGALGSVFTVPQIPTWYSGLIKPALNPPSWIFFPVWTTLYTLMGIAAFLVFSKGFEKRDVRVALGIFGAQLVLNAAWSIVFFGLQSPGIALGVIALLFVSILLTIRAFYKISVVAALLLVPYILWVSFAAYLNFGIFILN